METGSLLHLLTSIDGGVVSALNGFVGISPRFDKTIHLINGNGLIKGLPFVMLLWWLGTRECSYAFMFRWISGVFCALVFARLIQNYGALHIRPIADPAMTLNAFAAADPNFLVKMNSFPSDQAVEFGAMSLAIESRSRWLGWMSLIWCAALILLPRVYFGYHYPSDVLAGVIIGAAIMFAFLNTPAPRFLQSLGATLMARAPGVMTALAFFASTQIVSNFAEIRELFVGFGVA